MSGKAVTERQNKGILQDSNLLHLKATERCVAVCIVLVSQSQNFLLTSNQTQVRQTGWRIAEIELQDTLQSGKNLGFDTKSKSTRQ
jgi:hypothetical protein